MRGRCIKTDRGTDLGIPELREVCCCGPPSQHHAYETIPPFCRCLVRILHGLVTMPGKNQYLRVARDGVRRSAACQSDFGVAVRDEILLERRHGGVSALGVACLRGGWPSHREQSEHCDCARSDFMNVGLHAFSRKGETL